MLKREGEIRIPSGCAIAGIIDKKGVRMSGNDIVQSIGLMHDRSNGLGGGFAAYGIYPEYKDYFAFHLFYDNEKCQIECEEYLRYYFEIKEAGSIATRKTIGISNAPIIWRYFLTPNSIRMNNEELDEYEYVRRKVMYINKKIDGAYVFSSGKNMGTFKAVGYPEDVGEFYKLEDYQGYIWTAHGRFPTNTPGWWGGAHPFTLLDWSVVHNGEISSYDANRRFIEMFGYNCQLKTDTEVITYLFDYLIRLQGHSKETAAHVLAAPFWEEIERMPEDKKQYFTAIRQTYPSALVNGPFSVLLGYSNGLMALNDRCKLRALVAGEYNNRTYFASEESAIRVVCPQVEKVWSVDGGKPVIVELEEGAAL